MVPVAALGFASFLFIFLWRSWKLLRCEKCLISIFYKKFLANLKWCSMRRATTLTGLPVLQVPLTAIGFLLDETNCILQSHRLVEKRDAQFNFSPLSVLKNSVCMFGLFAKTGSVSRESRGWYYFFKHDFLLCFCVQCFLDMYLLKVFRLRHLEKSVVVVVVVVVVVLCRGEKLKWASRLATTHRHHCWFDIRFVLDS